MGTRQKIEKRRTQMEDKMQKTQELRQKTKCGRVKMEGTQGRR